MRASTFRIDVSDVEVRQLRERLNRARLPSASPAAAWAQGVDLDWLRHLLDHWRDFDWTAAQATLNGLPHFVMQVGGERIHFLHFRSGRRDATPVLLAHGWPGSFVEFVQVAALISRPEAHGRSDRQAFDVVVPSLPGFAYSVAPTREGCSPAAIATQWLALMRELGYEQFVAQGGDLGASVCVCMARQAPSRVLGLHLNYIPGTYWPPDAGARSEEENNFLARKLQWSEDEGAYAHVHGTKPQTLAYALTDSPAGLAAWIAEKFEAWSERGVSLHSPNPMLEALLVNLSLYWFTGTAASSMRLYWETRKAPLRFSAGEVVTVPLAVAHFPRELPMPPRSWVARGFSDIRRWTRMPRGGHFAALEEPELLTGELIEFSRSLGLAAGR